MRHLKLALSIARSNKAFSVALFLLYSMMMALLVLVTIFNPTLDKTFETYLDEYGMPDGYVYAQPCPAEAATDMQKVAGVVAAQGQFVIDVPTTLPDGSHTTLRYLSAQDDGQQRFFDAVRNEDVTVDKNDVMVSAYFADVQGIGPGDTLMLEPFGERELEITRVISCPESIAVARDESSWYDTTDFGYIYMERELFDEAFATGGLANRFLLWLADGHNTNQRVLDEAGDCVGTHVEDSFLYEGSQVQRQIHASLDTAQAVASYLPGVILAIGMLMSALFVNQVVRSSTRWIGLFEALGYTPARILANFVAYTMLLVAMAVIVGTALGLALLRLICSFYQDYYYLPYIAYHANPIRLAVLPLLVALVGIVSCMLSLRYITGVDPAVAYGGATRRNSTRLPGWLERAHLKTYAKVTICFMYRNLRRIALSALCIASCLVLLIMVLSFDISKNEAISHTFGERLHYDLLVRAEDEQALDDLLKLDDIDEAEKACVFVSDVMGERLQINAIVTDAELVRLNDTKGSECPVPQDGMLVEEGFATRHGIRPGDTVDVDGHEVIVRDITRQYVYCMGYVSFEQAKALGHDQPNALFVRLRSDADKQSFLRDAADVMGYQYAVDTHNQQHDMQEAMLILDYPSLIFVLFAVFIGLVIICNMIIISVSERQTEYATLLVLGVEGPRFLRMVLAETLCYYALACIVGCPLGVVTSDFVLAHIGSATQDFPLVHAPFVVAIACLITLCYMILGVCYAMRAIGRIRPESILNSR